MKKVENVREFVTTLNHISKFLDDGHDIVKIKDKIISQESPEKTYYYEFVSDVPDVTIFNVKTLVTVINELTTKSADKIIFPVITIDDEFIKVTTIDDGMKIAVADDGMVESLGEYTELKNIDTEIDLANVISRVTSLASIADTDTVTLNIDVDDTISSIAVTNPMTDAEYKKIFNKKAQDPTAFDFSLDFFTQVSKLKEFKTFIDVDRLGAEAVCSFIVKIPIVKTDDEVLSYIYIYTENKEEII